MFRRKTLWGNSRITFQEDRTFDDEEGTNAWMWIVGALLVLFIAVIVL